MRKYKMGHVLQKYRNLQKEQPIKSELRYVENLDKRIRNAVPNSEAMRHYLIKRTRRKIAHIYSILIAERGINQQQR